MIGGIILIQEITNEKLKDLSSIYDLEDTFISLYLDLTHGIDWKFISHREHQCISVLKTEQKLLDVFQKNIEQIKEYLEKEFNKDKVGKKYKSIALFYSFPINFFELYGLPQVIKNRLIVDTSPYIRPLAQLIDEWENYTLVLINNNEAELYTISLGAIKEHKHIAAHIINKHKKGGWSQMRFQRLRQEGIEHFFQKVVETLEKLIINEKIAGIVLTGPGEAKHHFKKELPFKLSEQVIAELDYDIDIPTERLVNEVSTRVSKIERQKGDEAVNRLRNKILKTKQAVYGASATAQAVKEGRVKMLILSSTLKPRGWKCERCQVVELGTNKTCPNCGTKTFEVDVLEEILEFAERTDALIEFVDDNPLLEELGGVGAILRY